MCHWSSVTDGISYMCITISSLNMVHCVMCSSWWYIISRLSCCAVWLEGNGLWLSRFTGSDHDGGSVGWAVYVWITGGFACTACFKDQRSRPAWRPTGVPPAVSPDLLVAEEVRLSAAQRWQCKLLSLHLLSKITLAATELTAIWKQAYDVEKSNV